MTTDCRIEMSYIDPETYTSIVNHELRKRILTKLYRSTRDTPISKQELADALGIEYHQLIYQLNHHLRDFWRVKEEQKVRGTRMELIEAAHPYSVFITIGKENGIFLVDPLADLYGPVVRVGARCDQCSEGEAEQCMRFAQSRFDAQTPTPSEKAVLDANNRYPPYRPMDLALLEAIKGIPAGQPCIIDIPCQTCAFLRRTIRIEGL
ncbi:MAG: hypothetical protein JXA45_06205 [Methanomassiliicoccales archaeon]|nr:hypothetical protein [Methanomassiliicoccales archaeon]